MKIFILILVILILYLSLKKKEQYSLFLTQYKKELLLPIIAPFSLFIVDKLDIYKRFPKLSGNVHQKMITLRGVRNSQTFTKIHFSKVVTIATISILVLSMIFVSQDEKDYTLLLFAAFMMCLILYMQFKELDTKVKKRKEQILIELPEFVNKIILLVNAGETVQGAINKSVYQNLNRIYDSPLYYELNETMNKLQSNASFEDAMKDFSQRCGVQEVSVLTTTIMMNYRKGGTQLADSLKDLSKSLWEKRKTITKIKGEEASSKMIFPMIFIFGAILIIIIYPALSMF